MFGQNNNKKTESKKDKKASLENIVIHTMKKDLAHPTDADLDQTEEPAVNAAPDIPKPAEKKYVPPAPVSTDITPPKTSPPSKQKSETSSSGPFSFSAPAAPTLTPATPSFDKIIASVPKPVPAPHSPTIPYSPKPVFTMSTPPSPASYRPKATNLPADITLTRTFLWGKFLMVILIILIILVVAGGAYYYWLTNPTGFQTAYQTILQKISFNQSAPANNNANNNTPVNNNLPAATQPVQSFSLDKPNYLSIDTTATADTIKSEINNYAQKVAAQNPSTPVEFMVTDSQNNPVGFDKFATLTGMSLPTSVMTNLNTDFSLFVYIDNGNARLGLEIGSKDLITTNLKNSLANEEPILPRDIQSIYLASNYTIKLASFRTSYYGGAEIRYFNIISPEELSVDYTIFRNKLLIGTTKMTLRSIIDYVSNNSGSSQPAGSTP